MVDDRTGETGTSSVGGPASRLARVASQLLRHRADPLLPDRLCRIVGEELGAEEVILRRPDLDEPWGRWLRSVVRSGRGSKRRSDGGAMEVPVSIEAAEAKMIVRRARGLGSEECMLTERIAELAGLTLRRAEREAELARADRIKTDFVRTVSHELRIPLNTVIGYTDLLDDGVFGDLTDEPRKILARVGDRARGLLEVIAATLGFPELDDGRVGLETTLVSVSRLFEDLERESRDWRVGRGLELIWEIAPDLPDLDTDGGKLRVIVKNLITNAIKFTDRGSVRVTARGDSDGVQISVVDTGVGIPEEAIGFVFDAFRQAEGAPSGRYGGVGLGLYIVKRLVGLLGGRLEVESRVGAGSSFLVWIPRDAKRTREHAIA